MAEGKDNVKVAIRVRPLSDREKRETGTKTCLTIQSDLSTVTIDSRPDAKTFTFDYVADTAVAQEEIFEKVGKPISASCISGYNGTIFAYGQTGAGKTYTILGPETDVSFENYEDSPDLPSRGLMPRCIAHIFSSIIESQRANPALEYLTKASFLEIYQEQVIDLLNPSNTSGTLQLREDFKRGVYVDGLIEETVSSCQETYDLLRTGTCNRHTGSTSMNKESSRSHCVFTMSIESREVRDGLGNFRSSRFHMIDLAGSERQKCTDAAGERLREAGMINKSLSALGNVINSLVDITEGKSRHVHYRDSKLTFLLKDSLGGNSKTFIVANVSPAASAFAETLSTLKFAQRAKMIKNTAIINEDSSTSLHLLKAEILRLHAQLSAVNQPPLLSLCTKCSQMISPDTAVELSEVKGERLTQLEILLEVNTKLRISDTKTLQNQLDSSQVFIQSLQSQLSKYEKKASNDKMVLKFRDATIARLQGQCDAPAMSSDLESAKEEISMLREQLETTGNAAKLYMENEKLRRDIATLSKELAEDPESLSVRCRENREYTEQVVEWLNEDIRLRERYKSVYEDYCKYKAGEIRPDAGGWHAEDEFQAVKRDYEGKIARYEDCKKENNGKIAALRRENQTLAAEIEKISLFWSQKQSDFEAVKADFDLRVSDLQSEIQSLKSTKNSLENTINSLQTSQQRAETEQTALISAQFSLKSLIETLKSQIDQLNTDLGDLQDQKEELELSNDGLITTITEQEEEMTALKDEFTQEKQRFVEKIENLTKIAQQNDYFEAKIREIQAVIDESQTEKAQMQGKLDKSSQEIASLRTQIALLDRQNSDLTVLNEAIKQQQYAISTSCDISKMELGEIKAENDSLIGKIREKEGKIAALYTELEEKSDFVAKLTAETEKERSNSSKLVQNLSENLSKEVAANIALKSDLEAAKSALNSVSEQKQPTNSPKIDQNSLKSDLFEAKSALIASQTEILSLRSRITRLESDLASERETASRDFDQFSAIEKERDSFEALAIQLRDSLTELKSEIRGKDVEINRLRGEEKSAKAVIVETLEAEGALHAERVRLQRSESELKSCLLSKESECQRLLTALQTTQDTLLEEKNHEIDLSSELSSVIEARTALETDLERAKSRINSLAEALKDSDRRGESLSCQLAESQKEARQYQELLAVAERHACDSQSMVESRKEAKDIEELPMRGKVEELERALEAAKGEVRTMKEESKMKLEILQNTNRNIVATRQEIEMWKKCLEEKNDIIYQLRHALRKSEEERAQQVQPKDSRYKPSPSHDEELQLLKSLLDRRESELFELKEKGQLYYAQADEAIAVQRQEIDNLTKRCSSLQQELAKYKEEARPDDRRRNRSHDGSESILIERQARTNSDGKENQSIKGKPALPRAKDELSVLKSHVVRLNEELSKKNEQLGTLLSVEKGRKAEEEDMREQYERQIDSLSAGINKITEFVFNLPIVSFNPEETGIIESTIKAISVIYEAYEAKSKELHLQKIRSETPSRQGSEGSGFINPANFKNPVAHYHALLSSSSLKPPDRKSPIPIKRS